MIKIKPIIKLKAPHTIKDQVHCKDRKLTNIELKYFQHQDYENDAMKLNIYTDGSVTGNGKKIATGGYGVFFGKPNIPYISEILKTSKITNNIAELTAIIEALKVIVRLDFNEVIIHYDSEYAAGVITGRKQAHSNLELVNEGKDILRQARNGKKIKFKHVYSHTGNDDLHSIGNDIVDRLAKCKQLV